MKKSKLAHLVCATSIIVLASTASAQTMESTPSAVEAAPLAVAQAPQQELVLNVGTPITLAVAEEVNSSTHNERETFKLTVLSDVSIGQTIVIPRGTPATAEITWRTGKGAFGKSGKMEFELRSIDLKGKSIPVTGNFRQEGEGNTIATGVGLLAVGLFAGFITGKRARLPAGRELMAQLAQDVPFTANGGISSSFDSNAAMSAAELKTEIGKCKAAARTLSGAKKQENATEECYSKRME